MALFYLFLFSLLLIIFHCRVPEWPYHLAYQLIAAGIITLIIYLNVQFPFRTVIELLRLFYPIGLAIFCWIELQPTVSMIYGDFWATELVIKMDRFLFGVNPVVYFQAYSSAWLNELMGFLYSGYYLFPPVVSLWLFFTRKKRALLASLSLVISSYLSNFLLFFLFPALGPNRVAEFEEAVAATSSGYIIQPLLHYLQATAGVKGAAFPSSHFAGAIVLAISAVKFCRQLGWLLVALIPFIALAAVYLGYHHGVDVIAGLLWGGFVFWWGRKILRRRGEWPWGEE